MTAVAASATPVKRGPGRPPKVQQDETPKKRGPGRPPKTPVNPAPAAKEADQSSPAASKKRGRAPASPARVATAMSPFKAARKDTGAVEAPVPAPRPVALTAEEKARECLERGAASLQPHSFSGRLPCRDGENAEISEHLSAAVKQGGSTQVLFLSGMPGTGKTASVLETVRQLQSGKQTPPFVFAHVNAMRLGQPGAIFSDLHAQLLEKGALTGRCAASAAHGALTNFFSARKAKDPVVVLLVDEVDHLVTRSQAVLYRLFDWLMLPKPRLAIVAVSNTMDLPERLLPRVASRFGIVRVDFAPYRNNQILEILQERLKSREAITAFAPMALKLCAARVAAGSGDIRKALQLCRRALEVRMATGGATGPADLPHLDVAEKELLRANPAAHATGGLGLGARRFLVALLLEMRKQEADAVPLAKAAHRYEKLLRATGGLCPDAGYALASTDALPLEALHDATDEAVQQASRLELMGLVAMQQRSCSLRSTGTTIALGAGLDTEDLAVALEAAEEDEGVRELLRESGAAR